MSDDVIGPLFVAAALLGFGLIAALLGGYYLHLVWLIGRASWGWV